MIPEVGQKFGPYEILGRLGRGGMGLVFRAWDDRLHREVALKLLHDDYKMPGMRERFLLEARAASALNHPSICTIFDIGEQAGNPYLVMELLQGETLRDRISRGALSTAEIVRYGKEVSDALSAAHAKGIVHRDIKPANIFLVSMSDGKSQAKVLDFGLAKIGLSSGGGWGSRTLDLTLTGSTVGTLAYMSPEQGRGESLDGRSDLFSLGIVMYEMATRQAPFKGTTSAQMFVQLFNHDPEPVRNWNESVPRDLEKVIQKLLEKDRKERFQTAKEVQEALERIAVKKSRGGWLNKGAPPVLPLVRTPDPIARPKPPMRELTGIQRERDEGVAPDNVPRPLPVSENLPMGSPMLAPGRKWNALERAVLRPVRHGGVAESDSSGGAISAAKNLEIGAKGNRHEEWLLQARSEPDANQAEFRLDDLDAYGFVAQDRAHDRDPESELAQRLRERKLLRVTVAFAMGIAVIGGTILLARSGGFRPATMGPRDGLLLTVIQNKTGDETLDGTVMQGLEIELRQSDRLKVFGGEAYRAGMRKIKLGTNNASMKAPAQKVAEVIGAKAYLYGEIKGNKAPYSISVDVLNANSNDEMASLEETAKTREAIPETISKLAQEVRVEIGGRGWSPRTGKSVSLEDEASANVDALHAYALGMASSESGRTREALSSYQRAVSLDSKFTQAQMQLAWLYREQGAEIAAASAAILAQSGAVHASEKVKLLAEFCYQVNVEGDYTQARDTMRKYVALYPRDADGLAELARVSRLRGYFPEALLAAQQSYGEDPFHATAYSEAELALIDMDRTDAAMQLGGQARQLGVARDENALATAFLDGKTDVVSKQVTGVQADIGDSSAAGVARAMDAHLENYGLYLDNTGQMRAGKEFWATLASRVASVPALASAQASLLAQSALDRALVEDCSDALELANEVEPMERGPVASFNAGVAAALCGDKTYADKEAVELQQRFSQNVAVEQYYLPELKAATYIGVNESDKALQLLLGLGEYDQISLAPYLRGMAHAAVGQFPVAIVDFQTVLAHRGLDYTLGSDVYPMAEIGVARASASSHDKAGSVDAYQKFLALWANADQDEPLVKEALAKTKVVKSSRR